MKKKIENQIKVEFSASSANEGVARTLICAFCAPLDVTLGELSDVRCAVSEAVTNAIVHAYRGMDAKKAKVYLLATLYDDRSIKIVVRDFGRGIDNIEEAMQPLFTTDSTGERSGMGFAIMQSFMDGVRVKSTVGRGTTVEMKKRFSALGASETA